jgi:2-keto-3-deoxy-L-rhamnonate aldolase RhmA
VRDVTGLTVLPGLSHVTTRQDAERAVRAVQYPPRGERSFAPGRGADLSGLGPAEYVARPFGTVPRDRTDLARQIELGCQVITVNALQWAIRLAREPVDALSRVGSTRAS